MLKNDVFVEKASTLTMYIPKQTPIHIGDLFPEHSQGPLSLGLPKEATGGADATSKKIGIPTEVHDGAVLKQPLFQQDAMADTNIVFSKRIGPPQDVFVK
jgi:hypothetical protein